VSRAGKSWAFGALVGLSAWTSGLGIAVAGPREAEACAARLPAPGQKMFRAVAGQVNGDSDIAALMRKTVRPMVMTGQIRRDEAEQNATSVGKCLLLLK
jgi:hypothetical protein